MAIARTRLTEEIATALQQQIVQLGLREGDRMPSHASLAEDLSISIPSLREGLQILAALGIIRIEHGRGTIVGRPSISDYLRSVDPLLLSRSYSPDECVAVLVTSLTALITESSGLPRHEEELDARVSTLASARTPYEAVDAIRSCYAALAAPVRRTLTSDIIDLTIRMIIAGPSRAESLLNVSGRLAPSLERFGRALDAGDDEAAGNALREQKSLLVGLVPGDRRLTCATGSIGGTFYSVGLALATALQDTTNLLLHVRPSAGGIENLHLLARGETDLAFTQKHVAGAALRGEPPFESPTEDLAVICRTHHLDLWIVTSRSSSIEDPADLRGMRVSMGTKGGETSRIAQALLEAYGHVGSSVERRYLSISRATEALATGEIDVLFYLTGGMGTALAQLAESSSLRVLSVDEGVLEELCRREPSFTPSIIGMNGRDDVQTIRVETLLVCRESFPPEHVERIWGGLRLAAESSEILDPVIPEDIHPLAIHRGVSHA